uniref:UDP-glucuronosyltransferase n=1 Tax=Anisakis simplex TaxID=6269 RepID=A0A0M3K6F8_ANISI
LRSTHSTAYSFIFIKNNFVISSVIIGVEMKDEFQRIIKEFKEVMDKAVGGAVLISFGSIAQSSKMTPAMRNAFVRMFTAFPHIQFIWKYEVEDEVANDRPNVLKTKWVPQNDLLAHPNMKAFISHGGMNSLTEAFQHGVPIVCIPLFGDQMRNAKMAEKRRVATFLDKGNITETSLLWALRTVLSDKRLSLKVPLIPYINTNCNYAKWDCKKPVLCIFSYAKHSKRLARMIAKKPFSSEEVFLRHIEFAAEFGHVDNLDSAAAQLNFLQYYMIDIIVPFIASVLLTAYIGVRMVMRICCSFMRVAKSKTE